MDNSVIEAVDKYIYEHFNEAVGEADLSQYNRIFEKKFNNLEESFSEMLMRLICETGKNDSEIYNRAGVDRRLFCKIKGNNQYIPSKNTVLAFSIALELNQRQANDLLRSAGFTLSHSRKFDVIIEYFIQSGIFDINVINEVLFMYNLPLLTDR